MSYRSTFRLAYTLLLLCLAPLCQAQPTDFSFGVIGSDIGGTIGGAIKTTSDAPLTQALSDSDADNLAFVVADGFKHADESCSDALYNQRFTLLTNAKNGVILAPAASDWSECRNNAGRQDGIERLTHLRELFFPDDFSLGASKVPLIRQSITPKFRSYVENARWEVGNILFTTLNLPANNNRYRTEAGRNSEFEDRAIATREWLHRSFANAAFRKMASIVIICDGNPLPKSGAPHPADGRRDGFAEVRQQLTTLAGKFPGKVLVIHNYSDTKTPYSDAITWHGNLGELAVDTEWLKVTVKTGSLVLFSAKQLAPQSPGAMP